MVPQSLPHQLSHHMLDLPRSSLRWIYLYSVRLEIRNQTKFVVVLLWQSSCSASTVLHMHSRRNLHLLLVEWLDLDRGWYSRSGTCLRLNLHIDSHPPNHHVLTDVVQVENSWRNTFGFLHILQLPPIVHLLLKLEHSSTNLLRCRTTESAKGHGKGQATGTSFPDDNNWQRSERK